MHAIAAKADSADPILVDPPDPGKPAAGEVLCRTVQVGVCGTDREILHSKSPRVPPGEPYLILGHECTARIEALGDGVEGFQVGDLVVPAVRRPKTPPDPRVDLTPMGQYTERGIVEEHGFTAPRFLDRPEYLFRVQEEIASVAVFTEPLTVCEKAVNEALVVQQARLGIDDWRPRVLVTGMGPIGFAGIMACLCRDWDVTMFGRDDVDSYRAKLAESFGAKYLPAGRANLAPDDVEANGYDLILECTGSDHILIQAVESLATCGVMVWLGAPYQSKPLTHDLSRMMRDCFLRNHIYLGSVNAAPRDFRDALAHLAQLNRTHHRELAALFTNRVTPDESLESYHDRKPQSIKTVLMYE